MNLSRRHFLDLAACAAIAAPLSSGAEAQSYPTRAVRVVVGFPAGGNADILARIIAKWLSERTRQPFIVENRPGSGTNIATEAVARAAADGYTLLEVTSSNASNAALYEKLNFDFAKDIAPIVGIARGPLVMVVNPAFSPRTIPEFIAYAKNNPGKVNMASSGNGTMTHLAGELFKMMTHLQLAHIPFRGDTPALISLLSGEIEVYFSSLSAAIEQIKAGKLRALAVTSATRSDILPEIPSMAEFVPDYEASLWNGLGAPRGTPPAIIDQLNQATNAALAEPQITSRLADLGARVLAGTPADFARLISADTQKWANVVKFSGAKPT